MSFRYLNAPFLLFLTSDGIPNISPIEIYPEHANIFDHDEDIPTVDTTVAPTAPHVPGPLTRARAQQLNYQVLYLNQMCLCYLGTMDQAWTRRTINGA
jgi:hypothetical protein